MLGKWLGAFRELDAHRVVIRESGGAVIRLQWGVAQFFEYPVGQGGRPGAAARKSQHQGVLVVSPLIVERAKGIALITVAAR